MDQKEILRYETRQALESLRRIKQGADSQLSEAASKILGNKELLTQYVELRLKRKRKAKRKEKYLTLWRRYVNCFLPEGFFKA